MKQKIEFFTYIKHWGIFFLLLLSMVMILFDTIYSINNFKNNISQLRSDFLKQQKQLIKREVARVVNLIDYGQYTSTQQKRKTVKGEIDAKEIKVMIIEPYDWDVGTGLYTNDWVEQFYRFIAGYITNLRFGRNNNGYIFIEKLHNIQGGDKFATMLVNPNRPDLIGKFLSDSYTDARGREFRKEELKGLRERGECFVKYWYKKIGDTKPSPKISYFQLTKDRQYIVAAGVYMDDVEPEVAFLQRGLIKNVIFKLISFTIIIIIITILFFVLIRKFTLKIKNDLALLISFFNHAAFSDTVIDPPDMKYSEFAGIVESAYTMMNDKIDALKNLKDSKSRLEKLSNLTFEGILIHENGIVLDVNEALVRMTGYTREELIGSNIVKKVIPWEFHEKVKKELQKDMAKPYEIMVEKKNGELIPIEIEARNVKSPNGDFRVAAIRDITERKKIEAERIKYSKLESLGVLAGGIAHDFNNILTGLFGNLEMAKLNLKENHPSFMYLERAHNSMDRASRLTKQFITFAKGGEPLLEEVDLKSVVEAVVNFNLSGSNVKAHFIFPEKLHPLKADKSQLSQVVANLTINAKQAMSEGGNLFIKAENAKEFVALSIRDEGSGIPKDILQNIFDPFFTTRDTGNGLGLATVHRIVERHGGKISVESIVGKGTVFTVNFPIVD